MGTVGKAGGGYMFTPEEVAEALRKAKGMTSVAAKALKCSGQTVRNYIARYPVCKEAVLDAAEALKDTAELKLIERVEEGNYKATRYYLESKAPERGYGSHPAANQNQYNLLLNLSNQELMDAIRKFALPASTDDTDTAGASAGASSVIDGSTASGYDASESAAMGADERTAHP